LGNFGIEAKVDDIAISFRNIADPISKSLMPVNLRSFKQKVRIHQKAFKRYLGKLEKNPPRGLDTIAASVDEAVWKEVDCLSCANCCKSMTPTFTNKDIKRISAHLEMSQQEFKNKWLKFDKKDGDWVNVKQPCQFLMKCARQTVRVFRI